MPLKTTKAGLALTVRLTPKSSRAAIEGIVDLADGRRALKARVTAAPEKGKANAQLIKLIAKSAGVPASHLTLQSGETSRIKVVAISGGGDEQTRQIRAWIEGMS